MGAAPSLPRRTFRIAEVAAMLGVPRSTVYDMHRTGRLKTVKLGSVVLVRAEDLDALLAGTDAGTSSVTTIKARRGRR